MSEQVRLHATRYIWTAFALIMILMIAGATFSGAGIEAPHVIISIVLSICAFLATGVVWNFGDVDNESHSKRHEDKSKVDTGRLDDLMDSLSPHDMAILRQRLSETNEDDNPYILGEDGELLRISLVKRLNENP